MKGPPNDDLRRNHIHERKRWPSSSQNLANTGGCSFGLSGRDLDWTVFCECTLPEGPEIIPPRPPADVPYVVANGYVNFRSGPDTEFPAYGVAAAGAAAETIGVRSDRIWWMIKLPTSTAPDGTGWVPAEYVAAYNTDQIAVPEPYLEP